MSQRYEINGKEWRVVKWPDLREEFSLGVPDLPEFHAIAAKRPAWRLVRRRFGMQPIGYDASVEDADLRAWKLTELLESEGVTRAQLQAELAALAGAWRALRRSAPAPAPESRPAAAPRETLDLRTDEDILRRYALHDADPGVHQDWMITRTLALRRVLDQPNLEMLGREVLLTELALRKLIPGEKGYNTERKVLLELYQSQLGQLDKLAPWTTALIGGVKLSGALAEITKGLMEYYATGDTALIDGIFTATEIRVELRRSEQTPLPRYRPGLVTHLQSAREGVLDPRWKPLFKPHELARLDKAFAAALAGAHESSGAPPIPNLQSQGPSGEYENLEP